MHIVISPHDRLAPLRHLDRKFKLIFPTPTRKLGHGGLRSIHVFEVNHLDLIVRAGNVFELSSCSVVLRFTLVNCVFERHCRFERGHLERHHDAGLDLA